MQPDNSATPFGCPSAGVLLQLRTNCRDLREDLCQPRYTPLPPAGDLPLPSRRNPLGYFTSPAAPAVLACALVWLFVAAPAAAAGADSQVVREGIEPVAPMSAKAQNVYAKTDVLMRQPGDDVGQRMMALLMPVVRAEPHALLIGRLVVAAARLSHGDNGEQRAQRLFDAADGSPEDPFAQFVAGVAAHYRGHGSGKDRADKSRLYRKAIGYLLRAEPKLNHAPRLWIYLAVSYYRTGEMDKAKTAIDRAEAAEKGEDADVYYCEAEVYHQEDPARALKAIEKYLQIMAHNRKRGAYTAPHKEAAVARMKAHLEDVVAGRARPQGLELFDPVITAPLLPRGWVKWLVALVFALGPLGLVVGFKRLRRGGSD